jgi:hypothetical protein
VIGPQRDKKMGFSKRVQVQKGKEKVIEPQYPKRLRDIKCFKYLWNGHISS